MMTPALQIQSIPPPDLLGDAQPPETSPVPIHSPRLKRHWIYYGRAYILMIGVVILCVSGLFLAYWGDRLQSRFQR
jgi:hypothetical protein